MIGVVRDVLVFVVMSQSMAGTMSMSMGVRRMDSCNRSVTRNGCSLLQDRKCRGAGTGKQPRQYERQAHVPEPPMAPSSGPRPQPCLCTRVVHDTAQLPPPTRHGKPWIPRITLPPPPQNQSKGLNKCAADSSNRFDTG